MVIHINLPLQADISSVNLSQTLDDASIESNDPLGDSLLDDIIDEPEADSIESPRTYSNQKSKQHVFDDFIDAAGVMEVDAQGSNSTLYNTEHVFDDFIVASIDVAGEMEVETEVPKEKAKVPDNTECPKRLVFLP